MPPEELERLLGQIVQDMPRVQPDEIINRLTELSPSETAEFRTFDALTGDGQVENYAVFNESVHIDQFVDITFYTDEGRAVINLGPDDANPDARLSIEYSNDNGLELVRTFPYGEEREQITPEEATERLEFIGSFVDYNGNEELWENYSAVEQEQASYEDAVAHEGTDDTVISDVSDTVSPVDTVLGKIEEFLNGEIDNPSADEYISDSGSVAVEYSEFDDGFRMAFIAIETADGSVEEYSASREDPATGELSEETHFSVYNQEFSRSTVAGDISDALGDGNNVDHIAKDDFESNISADDIRDALADYDGADFDKIDSDDYEDSELDTFQDDIDSIIDDFSNELDDMDFDNDKNVDSYDQNNIDDVDYPSDSDLKDNVDYDDFDDKNNIDDDGAADLDFGRER